MGEAIAFAVHFQDVHVMGQPVEESAGQSLEAKDACPFVEGQIAGHDGRASFIALAECREPSWRENMELLRPVRGLRFSLNRPRFLLFVVRGNARLTALMAHWAIVPAEITPPPR